MQKHGVATEVVRLVDHDVATGVWPDMTEHGWAIDEWPAIQEKVWAADILVIAGPIWLGDNSSSTKRCIERLYASSGDLNDKGQWRYYGRVGGCLITGNEDGIKHCAMNVLYSLQHIGYSIPPQADAGWIGEAGPGPSYLDPGSGGPENEFTSRNTTFMTWNLHAPGRDAARSPAASRPTATSAAPGTTASGSTGRTPSTGAPDRAARTPPCRSARRPAQAVTRLATSQARCCGGPGNPPWRSWSAGMRIWAANVSNAASESQTAAMRKPPSVGPAAW